MSQKRLMLIDDDHNILTTLSLLLEEEGYAVFTYSDGEAALRELARDNTDLLVLDIKMPRIDGLEVLRRVRQKSNIPVIFLTSKDDEADEATGLALGADDYVKKPFSQRLLLARIKALLRRTNHEEPRTVKEKIINRGHLTLDPLQHTCFWKNKNVSVTVTEFLILHTLVQHVGFVKTREQLVEVAYHDNEDIDDRTIDSHIKRLRKKFRAVDPLFDEIETLYGVGYKWLLPNTGE